MFKGATFAAWYNLRMVSFESFATNFFGFGEMQGNHERNLSERPQDSLWCPPKQKLASHEPKSARHVKMNVELRALRPGRKNSW